MKWKSDNSDKVWSVRLLMDGGRASVAQLKCGDETIQSNVTITYDRQSDNIYVNAVSYTHLTLPTILSV